MACQHRLPELHPTDGRGWRALESWRRYAARCRSCEAVVALHLVPGDGCLAPIGLLAWLAGHRPEPERQHLHACERCRTQLLEAAASQARPLPTKGARRLRAARRVPRRASGERAGWRASAGREPLVAGALLASLGLLLLGLGASIFSTPLPPQGGRDETAARLERRTPAPDPGPPQPTRPPSRPVERARDPFPAWEASSPLLDAPEAVEPAAAPAPDASPPPPPEPARVASLPQLVRERPAVLVQVAEGSRIRDQDGPWRPFLGGRVGAGQELQAGTSGGWVDLAGGRVWLEADARLRGGDEALVLLRGQAVLEGPGPLRLDAAPGRVEVTGLALTELRGGRLGMASYHGSARCVHRGGRVRELGPGESLRLAGGGFSAIHRFAPPRGAPQSAPTWVARLRERAAGLLGGTSASPAPEPGPAGDTDRE